MFATDLSRLPVKIEYIIGIFLMISSTLYLRDFIDIDYWFYEVYIVFSMYVLQFATGLIIILLPKKILSQTVGIVAVGLGLSKIFDGYYTVRTVYDSDFMFAMGLLFIGVGLVLVANAIVYLRGMSRNINPIAYSVIALAGLEVFLNISYLRIGMPFEYVFTFERFVYYGVFVLFFLMLKSDGINESTTMWKIKESSHGIKANLFVNPKIAIVRNNFRRLCEISECGMPGPSVMFILKTPKRDYLKLLLQRSEIDGSTMALVTGSSDHSYFGGFRFKLTAVIPYGGDIDDCDRVRLYGDDGTFIQLLVMDLDVPVKKRAGKFKLIAAMYRLRKEDSRAGSCPAE